MRENTITNIFAVNILWNVLLLDCKIIPLLILKYALVNCVVPLIYLLKLVVLVNNRVSDIWFIYVCIYIHIHKYLVNIPIYANIPCFLNYHKAYSKLCDSQKATLIVVDLIWWPIYTFDTLAVFFYIHGI